MKTFTMPAGRYLIADACVTGEYYDQFLDEWIDFSAGEADIVGDGVFLYCTGSDGAYEVKRLDNESVGVFGVDAANVSIVPASRVQPPWHNRGVTVEFDNEFDVKVYHDAIIVGDEYRIRL